MNDPLSAFADAVHAANIPAAKNPYRITGKLERFTPQGDHQENGWYVLYNLTHAVVGAFGCWKRDVKQKFCSADRDSLTPQQWNEVAKSQKEAEKANEAERVRAQADVREKCKPLFAVKRAGAHLYLANKGVKAHGQVVVSDLAAYPGWLALPLTDEKRVIHSAQLIAEDGAKRFMFGGRIQGCWFNLSDLADGPLVITEGYATGASVHEATGWATVCAMNAGNIMAVAAVQRKLHPKRTILIAADDDQFTDGNPGKTKAGLAAKASNATVVLPAFADEAMKQKPTDFNDLHRLAGLSEVKRQLVEGARMGGDWNMMVQDACDTMTELIPEPVQIVEGLLCVEAKLVIGGSSKTYKTWITMDMAISLAAGASFLGRWCKQQRVLYVNFELKENTFKRRVQTIAHAKGIHFDYQQFFHLSLRGKISRLKPQEIVDRIVAMAVNRRCSVVVVDPIYKLNTQGKDENAAGEQTVFLNELDRITTEGRCSLIFDDHFSKGSQSDKDPLDAIRGSSAKGGDVDAAMIIRKHKEEGSFSVDVIHRELPPVAPFAIRWQYPLFELADDLDPADMKQPKRGRPKKVDPTNVLPYLTDTDSEHGITISKLSEDSGISRQTLSQRYLPELRLKKFIATAGEGSSATQYITQKGKERLEKLNSDESNG